MRKINRLVVLLLILLPALLHVKADRLQPSGYYLHSKEELTFSNALQHCRDRHTDLVTFDSKEATQSIKPGEGWIGLSRENDQSEWYWSTGQKAEFIPWAENEPVNDCAFKHADQETWETDACTSTHKYMCFNHRVILVKENKTWEEALQHCRSLEAIDTKMPATAYQNHLYDLVSLSTSNDHDYARWKIQVASSNMVWTGLHFLAGHWIWVDGKAVEYQTLPHCPAAAFCGALDKTGTDSYQRVNCADRNNFLCFNMEA
ncbi:macrophage mannose receptor 1-like [Genypterus blacodes]|uniref:macrophage mannose receptor 1-like n=1 Tax=Genypterus blacodes TaxID=154954 RepID=UPI003F762565